MDNLKYNRRQIFSGSARILGLAALAQLDLQAQGKSFLLNNKAKAKRVISINLNGGASHVDLWDHKPELKKWNGKLIPDSVRKGQRITTMSSVQSQLLLKSAVTEFSPEKNTGKYLSNYLPILNKLADRMSFLHGMHTEEINHDPALSFINTGSGIPGKASIGAWINYGLGSLNENLPSYVVFSSYGTKSTQSVNSRLWGNGFLDSKYQGTPFYVTKDPIMYLDSPKSVSRKVRKEQINLIGDLNKMHYVSHGDRETLSRTSQYEMAFKMQASIPDVSDITKEKESSIKMYGKKALKTGSFANHCLMARRLVEKDVRFVQLFHRGWDQHDKLVDNLKIQCEDIDEPVSGLILDLEQRGLLEETLIICNTEFGRTPFCQGDINSSVSGRDHHGRCFTTWLCGGGVKKGSSYGITDDFGYNVVDQATSVFDLNATILHLLGIDHRKFTYFYNGLEERLTGVEPAKVIKEILS